MRQAIFRRGARWLALWVMAGCFSFSGCSQALQHELEVLIRPESSPTMIRDSFLVKVFGPEILGLFQ